MSDYEEELKLLREALEYIPEGWKGSAAFKLRDDISSILARAQAPQQEPRTVNSPWTFPWSWIRSVLSQGASIQQDYMGGKYSTYEEYAARLDAAARERELEAAPLPAIPEGWQLVPKDVPSAFTERVEREMREGTVIGNPTWWAKKLWGWALAAAPKPEGK